MFSMKHAHMRLLLFLGIASIVLISCAGKEEKSELLSLLGVDEKIVDASDQNTDNTYDAITLLKRGEAYFVKAEYIESVAEFERFLSLYPFHRMAAFSQYKVAMSYYHQINSIDRDPAPMEKAMSSFQKVVSQFPQSLYIDEAQEKISELKQRDIQHQFHIGRFYFRTKAYPAAIVRFENILSKSEEEPMNEDVLYFLGLSYFHSGDKDRSMKTFQDFLEKYPNSAYQSKILKRHPQLKNAISRS